MNEQFVAHIKNKVVSQGVDISGECGAFEITKRVAWELRNQGYGLFWKGGGANCQGYSTDRILDGEGYLIDILMDSGGDNIPIWGKQDRVYPEDQPKWRAPIDPHDEDEVIPDITMPEVNRPPEVKPGSDYPSYDQFVHKESWEVSARAKETRGSEPNIAEMYHTAWRRLREGMSHEDILKDIN